MFHRCANIVTRSLTRLCTTVYVTQWTSHGTLILGCCYCIVVVVVVVITVVLCMQYFMHAHRRRSCCLLMVRLVASWIVSRLFAYHACPLNHLLTWLLETQRRFEIRVRGTVRCDDFFLINRLLFDCHELLNESLVHVHHLCATTLNFEWN